MNRKTSFYRYVAIILVNTLFWQPVVVFAGGVSVATGGNNTSLDRAGNGVPIVNIATPNANGLSHNKFKDYNVSKQGMILNNATSKLQSTQLGGLVVGNPNLRDQAAKLIINEVNGGRSSRLEGYTEVAGQSANVVVANPFGITCNGCGFINSPQVTLTTGKPIIESGELDRFAVDQGKVAIEGLGLDATQVDRFDIITRAAELNAELHANRLSIVTGANDVDASTLATTSRQGKGEAPELAIDASALGGMYAGSIKLVGTEHGVGVKVASDMAASRGDIRIDANGHLSMAKASSNAQVVVNADSISQIENLHASGNIEMSAREAIDVQGAVTSKENIVLRGNRIASADNIIAGLEHGERHEGAHLTLEATKIENRGRLDTTGRLAINGEEFSNEGQVLADEIAIVSQDRFENRGVVQGRQVGVTGHTVTNQGNQALLVASSNLAFDVDYLNNYAGTLQFAKGQQARLKAIRLDNSAGTLLVEEGGLWADIDTLINREGVLAADTLSFDGESLDNSRAGLISANQGDLSIKAAKEILNNGGKIQGGEYVGILSGALDNTNGTLLMGNGKLAISEYLNNRMGTIDAAMGSLGLNANYLDNAQGRIQASQGNLALSTDMTNNRSGKLLAQAGIDIAAHTRFDNGQKGIIAAESVTARAEAFDNQSGQLLADTASLAVERLDNSQGLLSADDTLSLDIAESLVNQAGHIQASQGELSLVGGTVDNTEGVLVADRITTRSMATLTNARGKLIADAIDIEAGSVDNSDSGLIAAGEGDLRLVLAESLDNAEGKLQSDRAVELSAATINNQHGTIIGDGLLLQTDYVDNLNGVIDAQKGMLGILLPTGSLNNQYGSLSGERVDVVADALANGNGQIVADSQGASLNVRSLDNQQGLILAQESDLVAQFDTLDNRGGAVQFSSGTLGGETLSNAAGGLIAALGDELTMILTQGLNNRNGQVLAQGKLDIDPPFIDNRHGQLAGQTVTLKAGHLDNTAGMIEASENLSVTADNLTNVNGDLRALGGDTTRLAIAGVLDNTEGRIETASDYIRIAAQSFQNTLGTLRHAGEGILELVVDTFTGQEGVIESTGSGHVSIEQIASLGRWMFNKALDLDVDQGLTLAIEDRLATSGQMNLDLASLNNRGKILANEGIQLSTGTGDITNRGLISTLGGLDITARNLNQYDGRLASGGFSSYKLSGALDNLGYLTSMGEMEIDAYAVNNRGTLGSQSNLRIDSDSSIFNRPDTLLFSGGDMILRGEDLFNQYGDVYSRGYVNFARNDVHRKANLLENRSGTIEAEQGVEVYANKVVNTKDKFSLSFDPINKNIDVSSRFVPGYDTLSGTHQCSGSSMMAGPNSCKRRNPNKDKYDYIVTVDELGEYIFFRRFSSGIYFFE